MAEKRAKQMNVAFWDDFETQKLRIEIDNVAEWPMKETGNDGIII